MTFSIVIMVGRGYFLPTHVHEASKLNDHSNENSKWKQIYRFSCGVINAYLVKDRELDHAGQEAEEIYSMIDVD